ncbi:hypothetical protein RclHR1_19340001 [Rhizophagus clarus]|uniref:Uncharacterized protein n=1 Tax=Rhizophagus clarus TaxID=94130 RepID=A0A2Z6QTP9_9GLOM|nr:hypothetical protein RclHR1_19340001 [Rhizophagus clarus]
MKTVTLYLIPEWIPYNNLKNINYLTKGRCSEIYTAIWIKGHFNEWNSNKQQLEDTMVNAKSHLIISNKWSNIVKCFGLTKDPSNGNYILVMNKLNMDLRKYLQQNHNQLTWKKRIQITDNIIEALLSSG